MLDWKPAVWPSLALSCNVILSELIWPLYALWVTLSIVQNKSVFGHYYKLIFHECVSHSLFARGRKKAHHLHGQLKPLEVMLQVLSFHREAVLKSRHWVLSEKRQPLWHSCLETKRVKCCPMLITTHEMWRDTLTTTDTRINASLKKKRKGGHIKLSLMIMWNTTCSLWKHILIEIKRAQCKDLYDITRLLPLVAEDDKLENESRTFKSRQLYLLKVASLALWHFTFVVFDTNTSKPWDIARLNRVPLTVTGAFIQLFSSAEWCFPNINKLSLRFKCAQSVEQTVFSSLSKVSKSSSERWCRVNEWLTLK